MKKILILSLLFLLIGCSKKNSNEKHLTFTSIKDASGRIVPLQGNIERIICSGAGALRLAVYLNVHDRVVAVDDIEKRREEFNGRPYALTHLEFKELPLFGQFRGKDNPELIATLENKPQVIFKTYGSMGMSPEQLQTKTGIPVVSINYGDISNHRSDFYNALKIMGKVLNVEGRADSVIAFFNDMISDLNKRTENVADSLKKSCYVGGVAYRGTRGIKSTNFDYPPFVFTNTKAVTPDPSDRTNGHADISAEQIIAWDPEIIFIDLSTTQGDASINALAQIKNSELYKTLKAVKSGELYGLLPYNFYSTNYGSVMADCYYVGKTLYPHQFEDIDPVVMADSIYQFLTGKKVFDELNRQLGSRGFVKLESLNKGNGKK